jgi:hypothetical protein
VILDLRHAQGDGSHEDYNDRDGSGTFDILWLRGCRGQWRRRGSGWSRWWYLDWHSSPRSRARCDRAWYVQHNTRFHHRNGDRECDGRNCHSGPNARHSGLECQRPLQRCVVNDGWRRLLIPFAGGERGVSQQGGAVQRRSPRSWRHLPSRNYGFTMKRSGEPIG